MWDNKGPGCHQAFEDIGVSRVIVPLFMLGARPGGGVKTLADTVIAKLD